MMQMHTLGCSSPPAAQQRALGYHVHSMQHASNREGEGCRAAIPGTRAPHTPHTCTHTQISYTSITSTEHGVTMLFYLEMKEKITL